MMVQVFKAGTVFHRVLVAFLPLSLILQMWVRHRKPEITVAVIKELDRRGTLKNALAGRDEQQLSQLLNFLIG